MADQKITQLDNAPSPVDTDLIETVQNVSTTPVNRKITWATIKAFLKTYFDTLYSGGASIVYKNGISSRAGNTASGTQQIAHGLGAIPNKVKISASWIDSSNVNSSCVGVYNGSVKSSLTIDFLNNSSSTDSSFIIAVGSNISSFFQLATITVDDTYINLSWILVGSAPSTAIRFMWEVE